MIKNPPGGNRYISICYDLLPKHKHEKKNCVFFSPKMGIKLLWYNLELHVQIEKKNNVNVAYKLKTVLKCESWSPVRVITNCFMYEYVVVYGL